MRCLICVAIIALSGAVVTAQQPPDIVIPAGNVLLPNPNSVPIAPNAGLEGSASVARVGDPSAAWLNPAGLSRAQAASISSSGTQGSGGSFQAKPSALIILFTGHSDLASSEPPTFVAVGDADGIAPPHAMERRVAALRRQGTDVEYWKYPGVSHGFGLGTDTSAAGWIVDAVHFWAQQNGERDLHNGIGAQT